MDNSKQLKILSFMGDGCVLPHTLADIQQTLRAQGHAVHVLDMRRMDRYRRLVAFADMLVYHRPQLLFTVDSVGLLPRLIGVLKKKPEIVAWFYDNPLKILSDGFWCVNSHLHLFLWDEAYIEEVKKRGFRHVKYQPFGTNPDVYSVPSQVEKRYDVSFVGSCSPARAQNLKALAQQGIKIHIFGDAQWRSIAGERLIYEGKADNRKDCPGIYSASRINLNITSEQLLTALPVRVFDATACGGFVLTDRRQDAERLFRTGEELVIYDNAEDQVQKIRYYLEHDAERERIAKAGSSRTLSCYTFNTIVPGMLDQVRTHVSPDDDLDRSTYSISDYLRSAWIVGMSCVKLGDYDEGARLLLEVLDQCPNEEIVHVALALLAARLGERSQLEHFMRELSALQSRWLLRKNAFYGLLDGEDFPYWDMIYEQYFGVPGDR